MQNKNKNWLSENNRSRLERFPNPHFTQLVPTDRQADRQFQGHLFICHACCFICLFVHRQLSVSALSPFVAAGSNVTVLISHSPSRIGGIANILTQPGNNERNITSITYTEHAYTVRCRYNAVTFLTNIHKRHPIARPLRRGMGCLLWIQHLIASLPPMQLSSNILTILGGVITALDCSLII